MASPLVFKRQVLKRESRKATNLNLVRWRDMMVGLSVVLNIVTKMKFNSQFLIKFLVVLAVAGSLATPAFAGSRSASIRVSCTVLPMFEITLPSVKILSIAGQASPLTMAPATAASAQRPEIELKSDGPSISINTNLDGGYQMTESLAHNTNSHTHLYSVTVL